MNTHTEEKKLNLEKAKTTMKIALICAAVISSIVAFMGVVEISKMNRVSDTSFNESSVTQLVSETGQEYTVYYGGSLLSEVADVKAPAVLSDTKNVTAFAGGSFAKFIGLMICALVAGFIVTFGFEYASAGRFEAPKKQAAKEFAFATNGIFPADDFYVKKNTSRIYVKRRVTLSKRRSLFTPAYRGSPGKRMAYG